MTPPLLAVVGLKREAALVAGSGVVTEPGGGDGAGLLARLEQWAAAGPLRGVVSVGIGGALSPDLQVGDWVVAERVVSGAQTWLTDPGWARDLAAALSSPPLRSGGADGGGVAAAALGGSRPIAVRPLHQAALGPPPPLRWGGVEMGAIVGSDVMLMAAAGKAALHASTGALAVDMESHVAARFAAAHRLPFAALRVISDEAGRTLPKAVMVSMKPDGGLNLPAVLWSLAKDPRQLPALIRTGREAEVAFRQLALLNRHDLLGRLGVGDPDLGQLALDVV